MNNGFGKNSEITDGNLTVIKIEGKMMSGLDLVGWNNDE